MKAIPLTIGLMATFLVMLFSSCRFNRVDESPAKVVPVRISEARIIEANHIVRSSGRIAPASEQRLSFRTGGIVSKIYVKEGQYVKSGQLLAELNLTEINATLSQAEELYNKALRDFSRAEALYLDTVATLEQYQNAFTVRQLAFSSLEIARFNKLHSSIQAPSNGRILKRLAEENEMIAPGYPVFLFGSAKGAWQMKVAVTDREITAISPGDSAIVQIDAFPQQSIRATVSEKAAMANPYTGLFEVIIEIEASDNELISGMIGRVRIFSSDKYKAIGIPLEAILEVNGEEGVVHIVENKEVVRKNVRILSIQGNMVLIRSGLTEGEFVITDGTGFVRPGSKLEVIIESKNPE